MANINLLKDKESSGEKRSKKRTNSSRIEYTKPSRQKDEVKKKIKEGGVLEFFSSLFKKKPKIVEEVKEEVKQKKEEEIFRAPLLTPSPSQKPGKKISPFKRSFRLSSKAKEDLETKREYEVEKKISKPVKEEEVFKKEDILEKKKIPPSPVVSQKEARKTRSQHEPAEEKIETLDVNLIPKEILVRLEPMNKLKQLAIAVGIIILAVGLTYGYLVYRKSQIKGKIETVIKDTSSVEQEIKNFETIRNDSALLAKKIDSISFLLDSHIYWSQFLTYLEQYTLPGVYYTNLAGTVAGKITLTAKAVDLTALSNQYLVFQNAKDFVESVEITSAVASREGEVEKGVDFSISLSVKPEVFYKNYNPLQ